MYDTYTVQRHITDLIDILFDIVGKLPKYLQYHVVFIDVHTLYGL